jgi:hypothetical protein
LCRFLMVLIELTIFMAHRLQRRGGK